MMCSPHIQGADETWDGDVSGLWSTDSNWVGDTGVPGTGDTATFDNVSLSSTTIDLDGIIIRNIDVESALAAAYTFGSGAAGDQTLTFNAGGTFSTDADVDVNAQIINADIVLGENTDTTDSTFTFTIDGDAPVTVNGNIDRANTAAVDSNNFVLRFDGAGAGTLTLAGTSSNSDADNLVNNNDNSRLDFEFRRDATVSGALSHNRTRIRSGATVTLTATGVLPSGQYGGGTESTEGQKVEIYEGTLQLNAANTQTFNNINLGNGTAGNGTAILDLGGSTAAQGAFGTSITYIDDSITANQGFIQNGTLNLTGTSTTIVVHDSSVVAAGTPELTISANIGNDGTDRSITVRGANNEATAGILRLNGTNSNGGALVIQGGGHVELGSNSALSINGAFDLRLEAYNDPRTTINQVATLDLRSFSGTVGDDLLLGATTTTNVAAGNNHQSFIISTGGAGSLTDIDSITYRAGSAGNLNGAATIGSNVTLEFDETSNTKNITIENGQGTSDLIINGSLMMSGNAAGDNDNFTFIGDGTLELNGTLGQGGAANAHNITDFLNAKTIIGTGAGANIGGENLTRVSQRNSATLSDFDVELDINGESIILKDGLTIGVNNASSVVTQSNVSITDSAGGGSFTLNGLHDGNRTLKYEDGGNGGAGVNLGYTIDPDINVTGGSNYSFTINVEDGVDDVDLTLNGNITNARTDGTIEDVVKSSAGTVRLNGTNNIFSLIDIRHGKVQIAGAGSLGNNDVLLGRGANTGTLEILATTDQVISNEFRIGRDSTTVTETGDAIILNNGTGAVLFSNTSRANQEIQQDATITRTLTLGGSNTGDNIIAGGIRNNESVDATNNGLGVIALTKQDAGKWILNGDNTYTGDTAVNAGTLEINGTNTSNVSVAANATLAGGGSTTGTLTLVDDAIININNSSGGFTASGGLNLTGVTAGAIDIEITAAVPGIIEVLNYNGISLGGFTPNVDGATFFNIASSVAASARNPGGGTLTDNGTAITYDLGFEDKTWVGGVNGDWDNEDTPSGTANWTGGADSLFYNGDSVTFDDSASTFTVTLQENVTVQDMTISHLTDSTNNYIINDAGGNETITVNGNLQFDGGDGNANNDAEINVIIAGSGSLRIGDDDLSRDPTDNTLTLSGNNTFSGGTIFQEGFVFVENSNAFGTGTILMDETGGGTNDSRDPILRLNANGLNIANDIVMGNTGTKILRLQAATGEFSGNITNNETSDTNTRIEVATNDVLTVSGKISGNGFTVRSTDQDMQGTVRLTNAANDFNGNLVVATQLEVASIGNAGVASHTGATSRIILGNSANATPTNNNNSDGNLIYTGAGETSDKEFQIGNYWFSAGNNGGNGGAITNNSATNGALIFSNSTFNVQETRVAADIGARTLTLAGTSTATNVISGIIQDNAASDAFDDETVAVTVDTDGTWQLDGANTYTGATTVTNGTLLVNGSTAAGSAVSVASDGTLGGSGTINGATTVDGTLTGGLRGADAAGTIADIDTLSFTGNLSANSGATWLVDLNNELNGNSDVIALGDISTSVIDLTNFNLAVNNFGAFTLGNTYNIATYTLEGGDIGSTFSNLLNSGDEVTGLGGGKFQITYGNLISDNDYSIRLTAVPEPTTFLLLLPLLLVGLWMHRQRKLKQEVPVATEQP